MRDIGFPSNVGTCVGDTYRILYLFFQAIRPLLLLEIDSKAISIIAEYDLFCPVGTRGSRFSLLYFQKLHRAINTFAEQ